MMGMSITTALILVLVYSSSLLYQATGDNDRAAGKYPIYCWCYFPSDNRNNTNNTTACGCTEVQKHTHENQAMDATSDERNLNARSPEVKLNSFTKTSTTYFDHGSFWTKSEETLKGWLTPKIPVTNISNIHEALADLNDSINNISKLLNRSDPNTVTTIQQITQLTQDSPTGRRVLKKIQNNTTWPKSRSPHWSGLNHEMFGQNQESFDTNFDYGQGLPVKRATRRPLFAFLQRVVEDHHQIVAEKDNSKNRENRILPSLLNPFKTPGSGSGRRTTKRRRRPFRLFDSLKEITIPDDGLNNRNAEVNFGSLKEAKRVEDNDEVYNSTWSPSSKSNSRGKRNQQLVFDKSVEPKVARDAKFGLNVTLLARL